VGACRAYTCSFANLEPKPLCTSMPDCRRFSSSHCAHCADLGVHQNRQRAPAPTWCCPKCRFEYTASHVPSEYHCYWYEASLITPATVASVTLPSCTWCIGSCARCIVFQWRAAKHQPLSDSALSSACTWRSGKETNPTPDLWLPAHTCGEPCRRELACGHTCMLLCHPGPCPACPRMVRTPAAAFAASLRMSSESLQLKRCSI